MRLIIYAIFFVTIFSVVNASVINYYVNYSLLPFSTTERFTYVGIQNETLNVSFGAHSFGNTSYVFTSASEPVTIVIDVLVNKDIGVQNFSENITFRSPSINENITMNFVINNDTRYDNTTGFLRVDIGTYEFSVCNNILPYNTIKKGVSIAGNSGDVVNTSFNSSVFTIPYQITIGSGGISVIDIPITLANMSAQVYSEKIIFRKNNSEFNMTFNFNILDCGLELFDLKKRLEECSQGNKSQQEYADCVFVANSDFYMAMADYIVRNQQRKIVNNTVIVERNNTVLTPALPIDDEGVASTILGLPESMRDFRKLVNDYEANKDLESQRYTELQYNISQKFNVIHEQILSEVSDIVDENNDLQQENNVFREKYVKKGTVYFWLFILLLIGIGVFAYFKIEEANPY